MAGSHESNPVTKKHKSKHSSSKKHKSKSGKSHHERSRKSGQSDEHHEERHELREVSGQTPGQEENVQGECQIRPHPPTPTNSPTTTR